MEGRIESLKFWKAFSFSHLGELGVNNFHFKGGEYLFQTKGRVSAIIIIIIIIKNPLKKVLFFFFWLRNTLKKVNAIDPFSKEGH